MTRHVATCIRFMLIAAAVLVLSSPVQSEAKGTKVGFETSFVPLGEPTFSNAALRIKTKEGKVKFVMRRVDFPTGTPGELVLTLMVNDQDPIDVRFPFDVQRNDADDASNRIKIKTFLGTTLDLDIGDIVSVLNADVMIVVGGVFTTHRHSRIYA